MKTLFAWIVAIATACIMPAQVTELNALMKGMAADFSALGKPAGMTAPRAARAAERIGSTYENMIEFWRQQKVENAVKLSQEGKLIAIQLAAAINSGNAEQASAALKELGGSCHSCHEAYREKLADGSYRIKPVTPPTPRKKTKAVK